MSMDESFHFGRQTINKLIIRKNTETANVSLFDLVQKLENIE